MAFSLDFKTKQVAFFIFMVSVLQMHLLVVLDGELLSHHQALILEMWTQRSLQMLAHQHPKL